MTDLPSKKQMSEQIRQKLTETIFWLRQASETVTNDPAARNDIKQVIKDLEDMDATVARAFEE